MKILKKTYSKNNNEIDLIELGGFCALAQNPPQKTILIIGVFHGEEPQGKFLIENYLSKALTPSKNKLLFIPCLNPDGMAENKRQNANGIDLNRNFPTKNWAKVDKTSEYYGGENPASENETKFIIDILAEFSPDIILAIHAPYKVVNYDGPAEKISKKISQIIGYPTSNDIGYPTPGSFGNYAGIERNIPTVTLELDETKAVKEFIQPITRIFEYLAEA